MSVMLGSVDSHVVLFSCVDMNRLLTVL